MKTLITKLNKPTRKALEASVGLCISRGHYNVELNHFLIKLIETPDLDIQAIFRFYEIDIQTILKQLYLDLEKLPCGSTSTPVFSRHIPLTLEHAWVFSSLTLGHNHIRSGSIFFSLVSEDTLRGIILELCPLLLRIPKSSLKKDIEDILKSSKETSFDEEQKTSIGQTLKELTTDLTDIADDLDPICGRESEIRQMIHILSRRRQNNPILVGDSGVGKTAIVEGLAKRIVSNDVHPILFNTHIYSLNMGTLLAGASVRGEFEQRLKSLLSDLEHAAHPSILFIDEAHMLLGAGGQAGVGDAANLLKPALARGTFRIIAATTWAEYKRHIEKDAALTRRFERIHVKEPSLTQACQMIRLAVNNLQNHHRVSILNESIEASVVLTHRFLPERRLPDKALRVLDTACAKVAASQTSQPQLLHELEEEHQTLILENKLLNEEKLLSTETNKKLDFIQDQIASIAKKEHDIREKWQIQNHDVQLLNDLKDQILESKTDTQCDKEQRKKILSSLRYSPFVHPHVDRYVVALVIADWTGIPLDTILSQGGGWTHDLLFKSLSQIICGQKEGLERIVQGIVQHQVGLSDLSKPIGVFFLIGPSGVGKTETALALASILTGSSKNLVRLNMNEFQEAHSISKLKGAPPGYIGYGKGGTLTEAVRQNPYSVILMDEVDKAHPDVLNLFYQIFDKGSLEDSEGVDIDFRHTLFILTSSDAAETIKARCKTLKATEDSRLVYESILTKVTQETEEQYGTSFMSRVSLIPYLVLGQNEIKDIIEKKFLNIAQILQENHNVTLTYAHSIIDDLVKRSFGKTQGIRAIDAYINQQVLPKLTHSLLEKKETSIFLDVV